MLDQMNQNNRSIIDEIREDLALDNYYRRMENRYVEFDYDDPVTELQYEFEFTE
jgi:hypothetical protein